MAHPSQASTSASTSTSNPILITPLQQHEFLSVPAGFEYHEVSAAARRTGFEKGVDGRDNRHCVVCGEKVGASITSGLSPKVQRSHIVGAGGWTIVEFPHKYRICSRFC